tara:strand:- start:112 stop:309 length:198 start_codon:yes stop_codon:yes gene_type:complete
MKVGDLIKFTGSWQRERPDKPKTGVIMEVWTNGRTRRVSAVDVLWDSGRIGNVLAGSVEVINESR